MKCFWIGSVVALLVSAASLSAQAPRYGDLNRDGVVTPADTLALRALLSGDSSQVDSTYRARPDTLRIVANVWPTNLPGLGERADSMAPGWERPRWRERVSVDDLRALTRWIRGERQPSRTVVGELVPEWRLIGGLNMRRGDVLYLGNKVRAFLGPGTYSLIAVRRYPDSTGRATGLIQNVFGVGYLTPFWIGVSNGSAPTEWAAGPASSEMPVSPVRWNFEFAQLTREAKGDASPPGPSYPGCAAMPGRTLGDTVRLAMSDPANFNTLVLGVGVAGATTTGRWEVVAQSRRSIALMDSTSIRLFLDVNPTWTIDTIRQFAFQLTRGGDSAFVEARAPFYPTSSFDVLTGRSNKNARPVYVLLSALPAQPAVQALTNGTIRLRADCDSVARVLYLHSGLSSASIRELATGTVYWHELGHIASVVLRENRAVSAGFDEGVANLFAFRQATRRFALSRVWDLTPQQIAQLLGQTTPTSSACEISQFNRLTTNIQNKGMSYSEACAMMLALAATAAERRGGSDSVWRAFASPVAMMSWDSLVKYTWGVPLRDAFPQLAASVLTQGRMALNQGKPWQIPFRSVVPDSAPSVVVGVGQRVKVRADSVSAGLNVRIAGVPDSALVRVFTRDSTVGATSSQLWNIALVVVRE